MSHLVSFGMRPATGRPKFGNVKTTRNGEVYDSKKEAERHVQLKLLERNGEVRNLRRQVKYRLEVHGQLICKYVADYVYEELRKGEWAEICEDCKGFPTPVYRLKKKMMKAILGIEIRES